jgi:hypothetical protein
MKPFLHHLGIDKGVEARMRCDGTNCWFECREVGSRKWEKIARRVNRKWVSVKKGAKVTDQSILLPPEDNEFSPS